MTKDTRKLLIESSEFVSKVKLSKNLKESVKLSAGKAGTLIVKNVPCTILNRKNLNGRIYSTQLLEAAIQEAQDAIASRQLLCAGNEHPEGSFVPPTEASHVVINAYIKKNINVVVEGKRTKSDVLFMDLMLLNTENGKNARALFEAECSVGTSIRGLGDLNGDMVENYQLLGVDLVGQPSSSTYTRMPVSESVKVELADEKVLSEGFTVSTSATNVVRDLETASDVQNRINAAQYGTIVKTSTKVDEELNPKTGATTSITTLETETQDDVASLDQALGMAKKAMLNGVSHIDSITIDTIEEEEDKKEAVTAENTDTPVEEGLGGAILGGLAGAAVGHPLIGAGAGYVAGEVADKLFDSKESIEHEPLHYLHLLDGTVLTQYTEDDIKKLATDLRNAKEKDPNIIHTQAYVDAYHSLTSNPMVDKDYKDYADGAKWGLDNEYMPNKLQASSEEATVEEGKVGGTLGGIGGAILGNTVAGPLGALTGGAAGVTTGDFAGDLFDSAEYVPEKVLDEEEGLETIKEAKEEKDPKEGRHFVLKCPSGFVAMDGNALVFKQNPREALHFIVGKEESGLVHLSGVQKILDTMGVYDVEKYYRKDKKTNAKQPTQDTKPQETGDSQAIDNNTEDKAGINEEAGEQYSATVAVTGHGSNQTTEIPVSATDVNAMNSEISNLYDMKVKSAGDGQNVEVKVHDKINQKDYAFNPKTKSVDFNNPETQTESAGDIEQKDDTLKVDITDDMTVEKEFDSTAAASVVKSGLETGKIPGEVMLDEADDEHSILLYAEKTLLDNPTGNYYNIYFFNKADDMLALDELMKDIDTIMPKYAVYGKTKDVKPYILMSEVSEDELNKVLTGLQNKRHFEFSWKDGLGKIKPAIAEKLFTEPVPGPSDDLVEKPLEDAVDNITITLSDIDWDIDSVADLLLNQDKDLTWVEKINTLPSTLEVTITANELNNAEDLETLKNILIKSANETSKVVINGATIADVK